MWFYIRMDSNTATEIGEKVDAAISQAGRTKASVAEEIGMPWVTFSRKIRGHSEFSASDMIRIAQVLGVEADIFLPKPFRTAIAA